MWWWLQVSPVSFVFRLGALKSCSTSVDLIWFPLYSSVLGAGWHCWDDFFTIGDSSPIPRVLGLPGAWLVFIRGGAAQRHEDFV